MSDPRGTSPVLTTRLPRHLARPSLQLAYFGARLSLRPCSPPIPAPACPDISSACPTHRLFLISRLSLRPPAPTRRLLWYPACPCVRLSLHTACPCVRLPLHTAYSGIPPVPASACSGARCPAGDQECSPRRASHRDQLLPPRPPPAIHLMKPGAPSSAPGGRRFCREPSARRRQANLARIGGQCRARPARQVARNDTSGCLRRPCPGNRFPAVIVRYVGVSKLTLGYTCIHSKMVICKLHVPMVSMVLLASVFSAHSKVVQYVVS